MSELQLSELSKLYKKALLAECQKLNLNNYKSKNKSELIELIQQSAKGTNTNNDENIIILNNDCIAELHKLADNSIDCVITDPPYFIDKLDDNWSPTNITNDVKNSHIKHLPKGMKFDKKQVKQLYDYYLD